MATITRYVDPNAAAGGDGTTNGLSGATCAYASMAIWEAAQQQDLTDGGGDIAECICDSNGGAADTTAVTIDGWTTSATSYIWIHTPTTSRHDGKWNTSKYRIQTGSPTMSVSELDVLLEGLQLYCTVSWENVLSITSATLRASVRKCILRGGIVGVLVTGGRVYNCLAYDNRQGFVSYDGAEFYNCTAHNQSEQSFLTPSWSNAEATLKNCLAKPGGAGVGFSGTTGKWNLSYCASSDATADDWGGTGNRINQTFTFVDEAGDDFHLASSDAGAKDFGVSDPGSGLFSDDIDGQTRSGTWDIGADEYVSGGGFQAAWAGSATHIVGVTNA